MALMILHGEVDSLMMSDKSTSVGMLVISLIFSVLCLGMKASIPNLRSSAECTVGLVFVWKRDRCTSKGLGFMSEASSLRELIAFAMSMRFWFFVFLR